MQSWSVKMKLGFLCAFLMGAIIIVGLTSLNATGNVVQKLADLGEVQLPAVRNMVLVDMMHDGLSAVAFKALHISGSQNSEQKKQVAEDLKEMIANLKIYLETISKLDIRSETKKAIDDSRAEIDAYTLVTEEIVALSLADRKELAVLKLDDFQKAFEGLETKLEHLGDLIEKDAEASRESAKEIARSSKRTIVILILLAIALGLVSSIWFTMSLSKTLTTIASRLSESAEQVTSATSQIKVSSKDLSEAAIEQSASLEQTASALEQITAMISKAADGALTASESSLDSQKKAEDGHLAAEKMLSSMDEISQSNEAIMNQITSSNREMAEIVKVIQGIGMKTKVINDIVFQTKLLSFNASVEAARAGEHGKGFAVVAEEVGNLAQMSGNAAKEISDMLDGSILKVENIVKDTKSKVEDLVARGRKKVESGVEVARQCSELLNEIVQNVNRVSGLSQDISVATKEQAQGVREINKAMGQLETVTQKNSNTSIETASAATQLSDQTLSLKDAVEGLLTIVDGDKSHGKSAVESTRKSKLAS